MDLINGPPTAPPETLWHYTGFEGLRGILAGRMRASCLRFLNDTEEFKHGVRMLLDVLEDEIAMHSAKPCAERLRAVQSALSRQSLSYYGDDIFVACFSELGDDLGQLRAYGGKGASFSIGFDPSRLAAVASPLRFQMMDVVYERSEQKSELSGLIRYLIVGVHDEPPVVGQYPDGLANLHSAGLRGAFIPVAPRYKDNKFSSEKEWRLVRMETKLQTDPNIALDFRLAGALVVPYLEFELYTPATGNEPTISPITRVIVGPSPHMDELALAVKKMAAKFKLDVEVTPTATPYRNW